MELAAGLAAISGRPCVRDAVLPAGSDIFRTCRIRGILCKLYCPCITACGASIANLLNSQQAYIALHLVAPKPRLPLPSEKTYLTTNPDGSISSPRQLPCWYDRWSAERRISEARPESSSNNPPGFPAPSDEGAIEPAGVEVSVIVPAYNEAERILPTLEEMVEYLDQHFGRPAGSGPGSGSLAPPAGRDTREASPTTPHRLVFNRSQPEKRVSSGYEIIIVDDSSKDRTVEVALEFSRKRGLHDVLRVVSLAKNRGKGGAVTHGFRHARGEYVLFADADGASRFKDLGKLIEGCEDVVDGSNRGVAIGSRAHLVGSEAVVKVILPPNRLPRYPGFSLRRFFLC